MYAQVKSRLLEVFRGADEGSTARALLTPHSLQRPEGERHFLLARPSTPATARRPIVIVIHGAGASARQVLGMAFPPSPLSVWLEIAERDGLLVLAPDAGKGGWSDAMNRAARASAKNDVAFIGAMLDQAIAEHGGDPERVYVIGVSRGGFMAYRVALELGERLAAFSALLASMPRPGNFTLPQARLSALILGCTGDRLMPYHGGKRFGSPVDPVSSIEDSARIWREHAGLPDQPAVHAIARSDGRSGSRATRYLWGDAPERVQVGLIKVDNAGHAEPSRRKRYPRLIGWLVGAQNTDFEVAEAAWEFFAPKRRSSASRVTTSKTAA